MSQMQIDSVLAQIRSLSPHKIAAPAAGAGGVSGSAGAVPGVSGFGQFLRDGIDAVNRQQQSASNLADSFERGAANVDLASVMLETQKASVSFRALTEVRNRLVSVYQDIMNMSI